MDGIFLGFRTETIGGEQRVEMGEFYPKESVSSDDDLNLLLNLGRLKFGYRHKKEKSQTEVDQTCINWVSYMSVLLKMNHWNPDYILERE